MDTLFVFGKALFWIFVVTVCGMLAVLLLVNLICFFFRNLVTDTLKIRVGDYEKTTGKVGWAKFIAEDYNKTYSKEYRLFELEEVIDKDVLLSEIIKRRLEMHTSLKRVEKAKRKKDDAAVRKHKADYMTSRSVLAEELRCYLKSIESGKEIIRK